MAASLPSGWAAMLASKPVRFVIVYELGLTAGTLYYTDQDGVTWGGNTYTKLAVKTSAIAHFMDPAEAPRCTVTFDNVSKTLQTQLSTDLIAEKTMTIRLLFRDKNGALDANSYILHKGPMQQPRRVSDRTVDIEVLGPLHGTQAPMPGSRRFGRTCEAEFADGVNCNYTGPTTTAVGAGADSTALTVASGVNLTNGDMITIGSGAEVEITAGGGTASITLAEARTWSNSDDVDLTSCDHEFSNCTKRGRTHEYLGFRGVEDIGSTQFLNLNALIPGNRARPGFITPAQELFLRLIGAEGAIANFLGDQSFPESESLEDRASVVPIVFGRRLVEGKLTEFLGFTWSALTDVELSASIYALSEGGSSGIDEVVNYYTEEGEGVHKQESSRVTRGFFYRNGAIGVDASELESDYVSDMTTQLRSQNRDFLSGTQDPLSRTAYATFIDRLDPVTPTNRVAVKWDVKGIKCQKYTAAASPTTDGAPAFSRNPIWQLVAVVREKLFGLGRHLSENDIDFTVTKGEADVCDVTVYGNAGTVVGTTDDHTSSTYDIWEIDDTAQYTRGMGVEVDENGTPTSATVLDVWNSTKLRLDYANQTPPSPTTIRPEIPRYTSDLVLNSGARASVTIRGMLAGCAGYVTYDDGLIQFRIERATGGSPVATFKDTGADPGYQIKDFVWKVSDTKGVNDRSTNRVIVPFTTQELVDREAAVNDWTHRKTHDVRSVTVRAPGLDNFHQAYRIANLRLAKHRTLDTGAEFLTGPAGIQVLPGDTIAVTAEEPGWTAQELRVTKKEIMGLGSPDELCVRLTVEDYDSTIYNDDAPPIILDARSGSDDEPTITLSVNTLSGKIKLTWTYGAGVTHPPLNAKVWKSSSSMGTDPQTNGVLIGNSGPATQFIYQPEVAEYGTTLYFMVTAQVGPFQNQQKVQSNEVAAIPTPFDPTDTEEHQGVNTIYDGGLNIPHQWNRAPAPSTTTVDPNANSAITGGGYTNPANAYDNNNSTYANANVGTGTPPPTKTTEWTLPGTTTGVTGYWQVRHKLDTPIDDTELRQELYWSNDNGSTNTKFADSTSTEVRVSTSPIFTGDRDNSGGNRITFRATTNNTSDGPLPTNDGLIYEVDWIENNTAGAVAIVSGGEALLRGDGASTYGEIRRPWPGASGQAAMVIPNGSRRVVQIKFKQGDDGAADDDLLVSLIDGGGTYQVLTTVASGDIAADWSEQAECHTAGSTLTGPFQISIRTLSTNAIIVTHVMLTKGCQVWQFSQHLDEVKKDSSDSIGTHDGFPRGDWNSTFKKTTVST